jgi:ribosomal protein S6--L-glutamate ligase
LKLITFDPFRTLGLPGVHYIKPEHMNDQRERLLDADWLLFPAYWQLHSLHYVLGRPIFPSLASYHLGHDKVEMTRALKLACPEYLPETDILPSGPHGISQVLDTWRFPFVAKQIRSSQGSGVFLIESRQQLLDYAAQSEVLYIQKLLPIVRDLRVVVVGREVIASYWREGTSFHNNLARGARVRTDLPVPEPALALVTRLARELDIDHAGFDVAWVEGRPYVLEFNRLFGNRGMPELPQLIGAAMRGYLLGEASPDTPEPPMTFSA